MLRGRDRGLELMSRSSVLEMQSWSAGGLWWMGTSFWLKIESGWIFPIAEPAAKRMANRTPPVIRLGEAQMVAVVELYEWVVVVVAAE